MKTWAGEVRYGMGRDYPYYALVKHSDVFGLVELKTSTQSCYIGFSLNVGVCCAPVVPAGCPTGTQCAPRDYCGPDGHLVSQSYPGPYASAQVRHFLSSLISFFVWKIFLEG